MHFPDVTTGNKWPTTRTKPRCYDWYRFWYDSDLLIALKGSSRSNYYSRGYCCCSPAAEVAS